MKQKIQSAIAHMEVNVGKTERMVSLVAGSLLMYNALTKSRSITKGLAASYLLFRGASGYCAGYQAMGSGQGIKSRNINIKTSITVNKPLGEVYAFWRKLDNLPLFMQHLQSVKILDEDTSEWRAKIPGGVGSFSWKSEIVEDVENDRIGWRSLPGSTITNAGNVHFRDAGKFGTEVHAVISYHAPVGKVGEGLGRLLNPLFENMVKEDIRNFKRYLETNELPTIKGQPSGK